MSKKKISTYDKIIAILSDFPKENTRSFETSTTEFIQTNDFKDDIVEEILKNKDNSLRIRYTAFFALCTYYRRYKKTSRVEKLLSIYEDDFQEFSTYYHVYSMFLSNRGREGDRLLAVSYANNALEKNPNQIGFLHHYAESIINAIEIGELKDPNFEEIKKANKALNKAIHTDPNYAKFYCTIGRLHALRSEFSIAKVNIKRAIDKEDNLRKDYLLRISDYQDHLIKVQLKESLTKMNSQLSDGLDSVSSTFSEVKEYVQNEKIKNIEILGFFVGVISLIIGGIQIASQQSPIEAMFLILSFAGAQLIVFSGLSILVNNSKKNYKSVMIFILGLLTVLSSFIMQKYN